MLSLQCTVATPCPLCSPQNKVPQTLPLDAYSERPFVDFLAGPCGLSVAVRRQLLYGVALLPDLAEGGPAAASAAAATTTREGLSRLCRYLLALGRFGPSAFLASMYGHGEVAQALCRVCAVHGGIYVLRARIQDVFLNDGTEIDPPACSGTGDTGGATSSAVTDDGAPEAGAAALSTPPQNPWRVGITTADGHAFRATAVLAGPSYALAPLVSSPHRAGCPVLLPHPRAQVVAIGVSLVVAQAPLLSLARQAGSSAASTATSAADDTSRASDTLVCVAVPPFLPPACHVHTTHVLQLGPSNGSAPAGHFLLYCWTHAVAQGSDAGAVAAARADASTAAAVTMRAVLSSASRSSGEPGALWQCSYSIAMPGGAEFAPAAAPPAAQVESQPLWVTLSPPATATLDDEDYTAAAEGAWARLFPGVSLWAAPPPDSGDESDAGATNPSGLAAAPGSDAGAASDGSAGAVRDAMLSCPEETAPTTGSPVPHPSPSPEAAASVVPPSAADNAEEAAFDVYAALALLRDED